MAGAATEAKQGALSTFPQEWLRRKLRGSYYTDDDKSCPLCGGSITTICIEIMRDGYLGWLFRLECTNGHTS